MDRITHVTYPALTRRSALIRLGIGAVGLVVAAPSVDAAGDATSQPLPTAMSEWIAGWEALDAERIADAYAEDGVHVVIPSGQSLAGRDAMVGNITAIMTAIPDAKLVVVRAFATEESGAIEWTVTGHYSTQLVGFPLPSGQPLSFQGATLFQLSGGKIIHAEEYYDFAGIIAQMTAAPQDAGTPAATPSA